MDRPRGSHRVRPPRREAAAEPAGRRRLLRIGLDPPPGGAGRGRNPGLATGKTRQELYTACPNDRPNHVGMAVQRHIRAGRIEERDGKLYATSPATEQAHAAA